MGKEEPCRPSSPPNLVKDLGTSPVPRRDARSPVIAAAGGAETGSLSERLLPPIALSGR